MQYVKQPSSLAIRMHVAGAARFTRKGWDQVRPGLVAQYTDGRETSSKRMTTDEMTALVEWLEAAQEKTTPDEVCYFPVNGIRPDATVDDFR